MSGYDADKSDARKTVVVEARRKWSLVEKQAAIADAALSSISASARKHGVAASLLFRWRRDAADEKGRRDAAGANEKLDRTTAMGFVPVKVAPNVPALTHSPLRQSSTAETRPDTTHGVIEIELVNGHKLRVLGSVDADVLKQVIAALSGRPIRQNAECEGG